MANMTLAIPDELHKMMKAHADIKWSEVARQAFLAKLSTQEKIKLADELTKDSKLTPEDIRFLSRKINKAAAIRFLNDHNSRHQHHHSGTLEKRPKQKAVASK